MNSGQTRRWLFADQLGPHFLDAPDQEVLLIESRAVFHRRRFHRQKAHLVLSALRHRAAELGEQAEFRQVERYAPSVRRFSGGLSVCAPTSYAARSFVTSLRISVLPARGFATGEADFAAWVAGRGGRRLLLEDFYREARVRHDVLMDGAEPCGARWNYDADNREPPPQGAERLGLPEPWWPAEDEIDEEVRRDLDRQAAGDVSFVGRDGGGRRSPDARRCTCCATSSSTGCPRSGRLRTRCWPVTRGWRTACCRCG